MSRRKDGKKESVRLYRKIRNQNSWGTIVAYLLVIVSFILMLVFLSGFILEYIAENKFIDGYNEIAHTARLYEAGSGDQSIMDYIEAGDTAFIVTDRAGNILYQKGNDTHSETGGEIAITNGKEHYFVYTDSEFGFLYPKKNGSLGFKWRAFLKWGETHEGDIELPIWIAVDLNGGEQRFIGKAYFELNKRDIVLATELIPKVLIMLAVITLLLFFVIIHSFVNYRRVVRLFYTHPITSGHNWMWFVRNGDDRIRSNACRKDSFAVISLYFRNYRNYCLCHSVPEGEKLLAQVDALLNGEMKKHELCAYAELSNFALLLKYDSEEHLKERLRGIIGKLQGIGSEHNFDFRLGVDLVPPAKNESGRIVRRTDYSIETVYNHAHAARASLGDTAETGIRFFDSKLLEDEQWRDTVTESQRNALKNEEFVVYYQPKYDPKTSTLRGAEALVRWNSSAYGFVPPGRFISIFEKNGFITEIDHYMLSHVAADQKAWQDAGYSCVPVSVNVSRAHFAEHDLAEQIRDIVDAAGCPHELIEIELTESAFFDDQKTMIATIKRLQEYGFSVSMDDFGAGYSSLNSLKDLPLDVLKLDADFFRGENAGSRGEIVVSEAIRLAKSLEMRTVAEGVEEKSQVDFLAEQGCDMIQGYYYAKPMPKEEYSERMERPASE